MEFYDVVNARRTIRDFKKADIPRDVLDRILEAGMKAPSNDHMRDWHFIVVTDKSVTKRCLEKIPMHVTKEEVNTILREWNLNDGCQQSVYQTAIPRQYRMLYDASCMVIPLFQQKTNIIHPDNLSHLNGLASIWCCIENIFLAATAEGYDCTLRIPLGNEGEWVREVLKYPEDYLMPCYIAIGKPSEDAVIVQQKKYDLQERIHMNKW